MLFQDLLGVGAKKVREKGLEEDPLAGLSLLLLTRLLADQVVLRIEQ